MESEKLDLIDRNELVKYFQRTKVEEIFPNWQELSPNTKAVILKVIVTFRAAILRAKTVDAVPIMDVGSKVITHADQMRAMTDEQWLDWARKIMCLKFDFFPCGVVCGGKCDAYASEECEKKISSWLKQPVKEQEGKE